MGKPKALIICGHDILEYNRIDLFTALGFDVVTTGVYSSPELLNKKHYLPKIDIVRDSDLLQEYSELNPLTKPEIGIKLNLPKSFLNKFDLILACYLYEPIVDNIEILSNKVLICETLGQSNSGRESMLKSLRTKGVKIVRMSENERLFSNYAGEDAIIDLEVDENFYCGWIGDERSIVTVNAAFKRRGNDCRFNQYLRVIDGLPAKLYGAFNEDIIGDFNLGTATRYQILNQYRRSRVGFASVSPPCPITLSPKEMLVTGLPVVTYDTQIGGRMLSVPKYLESGAGYYSDNIPELREFLNTILKDYSLAKRMSIEARRVGLANFSKSVILKKWREFLSTLGV